MIPRSSLRRGERTLRSAKESAMLGPDGIPGSRADAVDELIDRIKKDTGGGGNGAGNNGGDGGGGGGEDPYSGPASVRMLIEATKQMAEHTQTITLSHAEVQSKVTT